MAEPKLPQNHEFADRLNPSKTGRFLGKEEYEKRLEAKTKDLKRTENWIDTEFGVEQYISVAKSEIALAEYYGKMPEVSISPDIKEFWETNKSELDDLSKKMEEPRSEYLAAYKEWQRVLENMDKAQRDELGLGYDYNYKEAKAREDIRKANRQEHNARESLRDARNSVSPLRAIVGRLTGVDTQSYKKVRDAKRSLRDARIAQRSARRHLAEIREERARRADAMSEKEAEVYNALTKMADAQEKLDIRSTSGDKIFAKMQEAQKRLSSQYKLIDQYKQIQAFKKSNQYLAIKTFMDKNDPELLKQVEAIPDQLPKQTFVLTLEGPLQVIPSSQRLDEINNRIASMQERITTIDTESKEVKGKLPGFAQLPDDYSKADIQAKFVELQIKNTDTVEELNTQMEKLKADGKEDSNEYRQLDMKKDFLEKKKVADDAQKKVDEQKAKVSKAEAEFNNASNSTDKTQKYNEHQAALKELQKLQTELKKAQTELARTPYSTTLSRLNKLQQLLDEKEQLENNISEAEKDKQDERPIEPTLLDELQPTTKALEHANYSIDRSSSTVAKYFISKLNELRAARVEHVHRLTGQSREEIIEQDEEREALGEATDERSTDDDEGR